MANFFKDTLGIDIPIRDTINRLTGKKPQGMTFTVGENLNPKQTTTAMAAVKKPSGNYQNFFADAVKALPRSTAEAAQTVNQKAIVEPAQNITRNVGSVGISAYRILSEFKPENLTETFVRKERPNIFQQFKNYATQENAPFPGDPNTPDVMEDNNFLHRAIFGFEPVKGLGTRAAENKANIETFGAENDIPLLKNNAKLLGLGMPVLSIAGDLFTGGKKKGFQEVSELIAKSKDASVIKNLLKSAGFAANNIDDVASKLVKVTNAADVLKELKTVTPETFTVEKYVQQQVAKREAARKLNTPGIIDKAKNFLGELKNKFVDFAAPIEDTLAKAQKQGNFEVLPTKNITNYIDRSLRAPTLAGQFIKDQGLADVIREVDEIDAFDQYLIAKQGQKLASKGIETGRDLDLDKQLVDQLGKKYEPVAQRVNQYSQRLLDYAQESGLVSKETADYLKKEYPDYVPFQRVFSEAEDGSQQFFKSPGVASVSKSDVVQKIKGSTREVESPMESFINKTNDIFAASEKNKAAQVLAEYKDLPGNPYKISLLEGAQTGKNTFSVFRNGTKEVYETTKEIAEAAKALNVQQLNIIQKALALPVRLGKLGFTGLNIPFVASNVAKDQLFAFITSKYGMSAANPLVFLKSMWSALKHDELYDEVVRNAGLGTSFDLARDQLPATINRIRASKDLASKIKYTVTHPSELLRTVEDLISRSEELTRIQQYKSAKDVLVKSGMNLKDAEFAAAQAARENTTNFYRRGEWGSVLNSMFLYLNAGIQGSRALIRSFERAPKATTAKIVTALFTPQAASTYWNMSDPKRREAYESIEDYEKQNNLIIIPPNPTQDEDGNWNVIKIPLPPGLAALSQPVRRAIESQFGGDEIKANEIASSLLGTVSPVELTKSSVMSTAVPQFIKPLVESYTNTNLFTGLPQIPAKYEGLSPELQAKPNTSGTARIIGKAMGQSPITVEETLKGYGGGVASQLINASDRALAGLDIIPESQIGGKSILEDITKRFSKARGGTIDRKLEEKLQDTIRNQKDEAFKLKAEAEALHEDLKSMNRDAANARVKDIKKQNPKLIEKLKAVAEEEKLGLDYQDRLIKTLNVGDGTRARFIHEYVQSLPDSETKNAYIKELRRKKIISDQVMGQLKDLIKKDKKN